MVDRARAYLATIPGAVSGQRGHDRTFYTTNRLVRGFALEPDAAFPLLYEWNAKCDPPWSDQELRHRLEQASRQPGPRGFLLNSRSTRQANGTSTNTPLRNYMTDGVIDGQTTRRVRCGRAIEHVAQELFERTEGWPERIGRRLFVVDQVGRPVFLVKTSQLFAWMNRTLGADASKSPIGWAGGVGMPSKDEFFSALGASPIGLSRSSSTPTSPPFPPAITAGRSRRADPARRGGPHWLSFFSGSRRPPTSTAISLRRCS